MCSVLACRRLAAQLLLDDLLVVIDEVPCRGASAPRQVRGQLQPKADPRSTTASFRRPSIAEPGRRASTKSSSGRNEAGFVFVECCSTGSWQYFDRVGVEQIVRRVNWFEPEVIVKLTKAQIERPHGADRGPGSQLTERRAGDDADQKDGGALSDYLPERDSGAATGQQHRTLERIEILRDLRLASSTRRSGLPAPRGPGFARGVLWRSSTPTRRASSAARHLIQTMAWPREASMLGRPVCGRGHRLAAETY